MSYDIEYNRQFILSKGGITPTWLVGPSNVTETTAFGRVRRTRHWGVFCNSLLTTEDALLKKVEPMMGGYQEHWMRNGKWVSDDGLLRWVKTGCKQAASIERVLMANMIRSVRCYLSVYGPGDTWSMQLANYISDTQTFDDWATKAKSMIADYKTQHIDAFPVIDFGREDLVHPCRDIDCGPVVFRQKGMYLSEYCFGILGGTESVWTREPRKAMVFEAEQAKELQSKTGIGDFLRAAVIVPVPRTVNEQEGIIRIGGGTYSGYYIQRVGKTGRIFVTSHKEQARKYSSVKSAERTAKRLNTKVFSTCKDFIAEEL